LKFILAEFYSFFYKMDKQPVETNTLKISLPSLGNIQKEIYQQIHSNVINIVEEVLENISSDKKLDLAELKSEYLAPLIKLMETNQEHLEQNINARKPRKKLDPSIQCMARIASKMQCSRKRQSNVEFCGSHLNTQPYGRIDEPIMDDKLFKKRGRPPKYPPKTYTDDEVELKYEIQEIDNKTYIVDEHGTVYEPPKENEPILKVEDLVVVGKKDSGTAEFIWY